jgi:hypothetical protein
MEPASPLSRALTLLRCPPTAGLVFVKLSAAYLKSQYGVEWASKAPLKLCDLALAGVKAREEEEVVVLSKVSAPASCENYSHVSVHVAQGSPLSLPALMCPGLPQIDYGSCLPLASQCQCSSCPAVKNGDAGGMHNRRHVMCTVCPDGYDRPLLQYMFSLPLCISTQNGRHALCSKTRSLLTSSVITQVLGSRHLAVLPKLWGPLLVLSDCTVRGRRFQKFDQRNEQPWSQVLASEINTGYQDLSNIQLRQAGGRPVNNLAQLAAVLAAGPEARPGGRRFMRFDLEWSKVVVIDHDQALQAGGDILAQNCIDRGRSKDIE